MYFCVGGNIIPNIAPTPFGRHFLLFVPVDRDSRGKDGSAFTIGPQLGYERQSKGRVYSWELVS